MNDIMPASNIIHDQRLPCGWTLTCHVSLGKHARLWRLHCCSCHHTDRRSSYSLIRLSRLLAHDVVCSHCCSTIMYASIIRQGLELLQTVTVKMTYLKLSEYSVRSVTVFSNCTFKCSQWKLYECCGL